MVHFQISSLSCGIFLILPLSAILHKDDYKLGLEPDKKDKEEEPEGLNRQMVEREILWLSKLR